MFERTKIREKEVNGNTVTLWKNFNKKPGNDNYSIAISNPGKVYIAVASQKKRDLAVMSSRFDMIVSWLEEMGGKDGKEKRD